MGTIKTLLSFLLVSALCSEQSHSRVLEITQKNLNNVLKSNPHISILFHNPNCTYSNTYHDKFMLLSATKQILGIVDCSQDQNLCRHHNISKFPTVKKMWAENEQGVLLDEQEYLQQVSPDSQEQREGGISDEELTNKVVKNLKSHPSYIIVLFEEIGLPVEQKLEDERVFYLQSGRLFKTLGGMVSDETGCWIFHLPNNTRHLDKYYCGSAYKTPDQIISIQNEFLRGELKPQIIDTSDFSSDTILGYKQLSYLIKHMPAQLSQIPIQSSFCLFVYIHALECEHCKYDEDVLILQMAVDKTVGASQSVSKVHSYNVGRNKIFVSRRDIEDELKSSYWVNNIRWQSDKLTTIVPNIMTICSTHSSERKVDIEINTFDKIYSRDNVNKFVESIRSADRQREKQILARAESQTEQTEL